jgi:hypothetical protein
VTLRRLTVLATIVHHSAPVGDLVGALRAGRWLRTPTDSFRRAKEIASLDLVSDGRVIFGVGTGWSREEMRNHGTDPWRNSFPTKGRQCVAQAANAGRN